MQQATQEVSSMDMEKVFFTRDLSDKTMDDKLLLNPNYLLSIFAITFI